MTLQVSPGPLPEDGTLFNPTTALDTFVNGTRVFNFGNQEFADSGAAFFVSQTDAPASATVHRALTWFKRGEGTLYHAYFFAPIDGPLSGATQWRWVAASGSRKEQVVEYRFPVRLTGGVLRQTAEPSTAYGVQTLANRGLMLRVMQSQYTSHTDVTTVSDSTASWLGYWAERHNDPVFVALDTTATNLTSGNRTLVDACGYSGHDYHVAVECGFCDIAVGSGFTGPGRLFLIEGLNDARFQPTTQPSFAKSDVQIAYATQSGPTGAGVVGGFLRPSAFNRNF